MNASLAVAAEGIPPYFDGLLARIEANDPNAAIAFGRHVHWGYWTDPEEYDGTAQNYADAAERLCRAVCDAALPAADRDILDIGCGFGGTLASLNERFQKLRMVGLNIDPRQLARAEATFRTRPGNSVCWVEGNACQLNFPEASFDVALAVECIFHFPERRSFFAGVAHALRKGGRLALSDFLPSPEGKSLLQSIAKANATVRSSYGAVDFSCSLEDYRQLGEAFGLDLVVHRDINANTMPTYRYLVDHSRNWNTPEEQRQFARATKCLDVACREGLLKYTVLAFEKR